MVLIANYEILGAIFLLVMIYFTFVAYKRKQISRFSLIFWIIIWIGGAVAMMFKNLLQSLLPVLAVYRIFDLYTIIGFMFFLFMVFYLFRTVKRTEKRVEELTRMMAMKENDSNKDNKTDNNK